MSEKLYGLHLRGALGAVQTEVLNGREHLVVPVVALMEGVIHPVNAETPEFVPWSCIEKMAESFNGKPVTLGHPRGSDGKQCSATMPGILDSHGIGVIRNARAVKESKKLLMEALVDSVKAKQLHPDMHQRLLDGKTEEVSVGAMVLTDETKGEHNGKAYKAQWLGGRGDHLAFLPGKRGACSITMGCGAHRAAMHFVAAEGIELVPDYSPVLAFTTLEEQSLDERMQAVQLAIDARWPRDVNNMSMYAYAMQTFDDRVIVRVGPEVFAVDYTMKDGKAVLGEARRVKQAWVAAAKKGRYEDCPTCKGSGNVNGNPCEACDGEGEIRAAALVALMGLRPCSDSAKDIHGQAMKILGDRPGHPFYGNQHTDGEGGGGDKEDNRLKNDTQKDIESIIGTEFHQDTARTIGDKTSLLRRVEGGAKNRKTIAEKLTAKGYTKFAGRTKSEDAYQSADRKTILSVKQQKKDLLVEYIRTASASELEDVEVEPKTLEECIAEQERTNNIRVEGGKFVLLGSDNKLRLGSYNTRAEAEEHAIRIGQVLARS